MAGEELFQNQKAPYLTLVESATDGSEIVGLPPTDHRKLFLGEDGELHLVDSAGAVSDVTASPPPAQTFALQAVFPSPAAGDLFDFPYLPFAGTFTGWRCVGDAAGSASVDVWRDTYAAGPPVVGDTIRGQREAHALGCGQGRGHGPVLVDDSVQRG